VVARWVEEGKLDEGRLVGGRREGRLRWEPPMTVVMREQEGGRVRGYGWKQKLLTRCGWLQRTKVKK
jgi:hypothetical protein